MHSKISEKFINRSKLNTSLIKSTFQKHHVLFAYLFGSYANGRVRPKSDVDIAAFFDKSIKAKERGVLKADLREEIAQILKKYDQIDIVVLNGAPPLLEREVIYGGKLIYSKDDAAQTHYQAQAVSRWLDWHWHYQKFEKRLLS